MSDIAEMSNQPVIDATNHPRPVNEPDRYGYQPIHGETRPCLGCGSTVTYDADTDAWSIPYSAGNPPRGTFTCPDRVHVPHMGAYRRFTPEQVRRDPRIRLIADLLGSLDLYLGPHHLRSLTTEQKELYADLVDADAVLAAHADPHIAAPHGIPGRTPRIWRDDYAGPTHPAAPGWNDPARHEPDPFRA